jgi:hypothetical protein
MDRAKGRKNDPTLEIFELHGFVVVIHIYSYCQLAKWPVQNGYPGHDRDEYWILDNL